MKTKTIELYNVEELKEKFPDGFKKALENWQRDHGGDLFWTDEIVESFLALLKKASVDLWDYSIGTDGGYARIGMSGHDGDLEGHKAYNWIKVNILDLAKFERVTYSKKNGGRGWRYDVTKRDGSPWDCEFTGVCYDHDFVDALLDNIKGGKTLRESLESLAYTASKLIEAEYEDQMSEGYFVDHAMANEYTFRSDGTMENE